MDGVPRRLAGYQWEPQVEYRMFVIHDPGAEAFTGAVPASGQLLLPEPGGVVVGSGGNDFYPAVTVESWDGAPPPDAGKWDAVEEADMHLPSGRLQAESVLAAYASPIVTLGEPGWYRIRAHCRGRAEAGSRVGRGELYYHGVEEWLMQVWPVAR